MLGNMVNSKLTNEDMPKILQYPGACGLTSLLMALKPKSRNIAPILDNLWSIIRPIHDLRSRREMGYNWQVVLEWLLFQTAFNSKFQNHIEKIIGLDFSDIFLPVLQFGINNERPFDFKPYNDFKKDSLQNPNGSTQIFNGEWLMKRVDVWKQDFELSIIANIFGCKFIPWEKTQDGTGALFFTRKELKKESKSYKEKVEFLVSKINSENPVLCCISVHWVAIKAIRKIKNDYIIFYHDPATADEYLRPLKDFRESDRFYFFQFYPQILKENVEKLNLL
jgi:hypothetical protein